MKSIGWVWLDKTIYPGLNFGLFGLNNMRNQLANKVKKKISQLRRKK